MEDEPGTKPVRKENRPPTNRLLEWRLAEDERGIRSTRILTFIALALSTILVIAVAALVTGLIALNRDVEAVTKAEPREGSVGTAALQNGVVTADKLAPNSVTRTAITPGAITATQVAPNSLTGASIDERTLRGVPSALNARQARNAGALGGLAAVSYLSGVKTVQAATAADTEAVKGPVAARCPAGTRVIAGGVAVEGATRGVGIIRSAPDGDGVEWVAVAVQNDSPGQPWRLIVTAICARGGS